MGHLKGCIRAMQNKEIQDFFKYLVVGGIATISEWIIFFFLDKMSVYYAIATVIAYMLSTFVNWLMGRILVFKEAKQPLWKEIASIYIVSIGGLLLNLLIMSFTIELLDFSNMLSKVLATVIVFSYNFLIRKIFIYK